MTSSATTNGISSVKADTLMTEPLRAVPDTETPSTDDADHIQSCTMITLRPDTKVVARWHDGHVNLFFGKTLSISGPAEAFAKIFVDLLSDREDSIAQAALAAMRADTESRNERRAESDWV